VILRRPPLSPRDRARRALAGSFRKRSRRAQPAIAAARPAGLAGGTRRR